jgi:hypothetical protein
LGNLRRKRVGKFNDFTPKALQEIKDLGVTYIWYTGVPHHALIQDYTAIGILMMIQKLSKVELVPLTP